MEGRVYAFLASSSELKTGIPSATKAFAIVDFPDPIFPVNPTTSIEKIIQANKTKCIFAACQK